MNRKPSATASRELCGASRTRTGAARRATRLSGGIRRRRSPRRGWLGALIPREYGGSGLGIADAAVILEEINRSGGNGGACHAQMYTMGTLLRHGSEEQKQRYLPRHRQRRAAAAGVRRDGAGRRLRHDADPHARRPRGDDYVINGQKIWTSRAEHSDLMLLLARTDAARRGRAARPRPLDLPRRPARGGRRGLTRQPDRDDDQPRHHRALLRRPRRPRREASIGEEGRASATSSTA